MTQPISYRDAGVDIDKGEEAVARIATVAKRTAIPGVLGGVGGFGGLFALKDALPNMKDPVLVSGTDGVGTKLIVAIEAGRHKTVGQDLVAMCVNDVLTSGARPLFFLDYYATGKLEPAHMADVVTGIAAACEASGCALIGGETAELPGLYKGDDYDLAGFVVGVVERNAIVDGTKTTPGDRIIGLASSGIHSNGYSLARRVLFQSLGMKLDDRFDDDQSLADVLLTPTALYVKPIIALIDAGVPIHAMAHITGGGIPDNLTRGFPKGLTARIDSRRWPEPAIFEKIRTGGPVVTHEMRRTFNLGIGFAVVTKAAHVNDIISQLKVSGVDAYDIGEVTTGDDVVYAEDAPS